MKKVKLFFTTLVALMIATVAFAQQNVRVSGTVTDAATGEAVPGATIQLVGSATNYALSDALGNFSISVPKDGVLEVSCLGFVSVEVAVAGRSVVNVALESDAQQLEETIVVAYGTTKKSSFTGSATQLGTETIKKMQTSNISKALEGAVAGLQTASSSGTPGAGASIQIRGFGSVSASTSPLIVVDGVPYEGGLNSIPSQDIESITVLKDAAANSLYGARGSNGVIIITTKRGSAGKVSVNFDARVGVNSRAVPAYETITDPGEFYEMAWEAIRNTNYYATGLDFAQAGIIASQSMLADYLGPYNIYKGVGDTEIVDPTTGKLNANANQLKWTDNWNKDLFRNGIRQEYNVAVSGGSDKTQGYVSASYLNDEGYVVNSGFQRVGFRAKVDHNVNDFIQAGLNLSYANTNQTKYVDDEGNNYSNFFMFAQQIAPIYPIYLYDADGVLQYGPKGNKLFDWGDTGRAYGATANPYGQAIDSINSDITDNLSSRGYVNLKLMKDLVVTANVAYDVFNTKSNTFYTPNGGDALKVEGRGYQETDRYTAVNANQLINWTPSFGNHDINLLIGHETKRDQSYYLYGHMTKFVNASEPDFANAINYQDLTSSTSEYFLEGFFSRVEYSYANKYILSASYRRDGSSRFSKENRWGSFWSVGAAWNIKQESFLRDLGAIDALRVKGSFGTQGNDNIGYTRVFENLYRIDRVDGEASLIQTFRAAPEVTWEKSDNFNVGIEGSLFSRVNFNVEYFVKETKDMIYSRPLPPSQGTPASQLVNDMDMMNKGIEFELGATLVKTRNIVWTVGLNGTHYKNMVTRIPSDYPEYGKQVGNSWREVGQPLYNYYLFEYAGVDPQNGHALYNKYETDPDTGLSTGKLEKTVTSTGEATRVKTGKTPIPDLYGGFNTQLRFYGFDFSANFAYQLGGYTLDSVYQTLMTAGRAGNNWHKDIFNRWTPQNTGSDIPRVQMSEQTANETSTRFLIKSSYISLRNVTLGYTLPEKLVNNLPISSVRLYLTGDNVWYLSARKGMDVRKSFTGGNGNTYSALRTISCGVSVSF